MKRKRKATVTKKAKRRLQKLHHRRLTKNIKLKCSLHLHPLCKEMNGIWFIDTTNPELYDKEVRKKWKCLLCRDYDPSKKVRLL